MNLKAGPLFLALALTLPVWGEEKPGFVTVGPLAEELFDAGCSLHLRNGEQADRQIFRHGPDGAWMNLNGHDVQLTEINLKGTTMIYQAGDIRIIVRYGTGRQGEGGVAYPRAKITLIRDEERMTIQAQGGCGC